MKLKPIILGMFAVFCLLSTGYGVHRIHYEHSKRVSEWNEGAKAAFEEALEVEALKRVERFKIRYSKSYREEIVGSVINLTFQNGKTYHVEYAKYENSLIKDRSARCLVGLLLSDYPLSVDRLALCWDSCLLAKQITGHKQIRYIHTDEDLNNDTVYSRTNNHTHLDSLTVKYLGGRYEHEFTAFFSCPYSLSDMLKGLVCMGGLPWFFFALLAWQYSKLERWICHKFVREQVKVVVQEKIVEVDKEIYVSDMSMDKVDVFRLPDGTMFHVSDKCLSKGGIRHSIQPQTACLLKLFLSKSEYQVTSAEICVALWQEEKEKSRLYMAVKRLRSDLNAVNSDLTIDCNGGTYELK